MEKGIAMQALKKSRTLWQMKGSSVHNVLLPCRRQWVRPKDGSPTGDTVNPHLDPKEAWSDGQPSRPWSNHSPLPRLLTCHLKTGPRGPALLDWGPDSPTDMIFLEGVKNSESMAKHGEIPCGTRRGGRGAFGSIGLWSYYLRLRPLSDGGQIPCGGHADSPHELVSPVSCPFMFAAVELFSWCLSVQDGKMKSRLKDVWDFSY